MLFTIVKSEEIPPATKSCCVVHYKIITYYTIGDDGVLIPESFSLAFSF